MQASSKNKIKKLIRNNSKPLLKRGRLVGVALGKGMARILTRKFYPSARISLDEMSQRIKPYCGRARFTHPLLRVMDEVNIMRGRLDS